MALRDAGGIWIREGKNGKFMSGTFQPEGKEGPKHSFMAFKNDKKQGKQPDYRIMIADDEDDELAKSDREERRPSQVDDITDDENVPF